MRATNSFPTVSFLLLIFVLGCSGKSNVPPEVEKFIGTWSGQQSLAGVTFRAEVKIFADGRCDYYLEPVGLSSFPPERKTFYWRLDPMNNSILILGDEESLAYRQKNIVSLISKGNHFLTLSK